jgi:hypothetical protein
LGEADADSIAEFQRAAAWDPDATPERAREMLRTAAAENPFEPGTGPPTLGGFIGNRLVAYVTSIPTRFWNGSEYAAAHWLKGWWVLEEYRNSPIGFLLLKEMLKQVEVAASLPAALLPRRLSEALGMRDLGAVRDYIEPLRPARILRKLEIGRLLADDPAYATRAARIAALARDISQVLAAESTKLGAALAGPTRARSRPRAWRFRRRALSNMRCG